MERITQKDLEWFVKRINELTGSPQDRYTKNADGRHKANAGNYHLDYAYGGVKLVRMCSEGSGVAVISHSGFGTKRELYNWMRAFVAGIQIKHEL